MCISATSSFVVASLLTVAGMAAYSRASKPKQIPLTLIPLGFAVQQAAEGVVWLTLDQPETKLHMIAIYMYLSFAFIIWPLWMPFAVKVYENNHTRKVLLSLCQLLGLLFAITAAFILCVTPVSVSISEGHLAYHIKNKFFGPESSIAWYLIPVLLPFFLSSNRIFSMAVSALATISLAITLLVTPATFISMWCFLAAIISLSILGVVWRDKNAYKS